LRLAPTAGAVYSPC